MEMETVTRMGVQIQDYSLALLLEKYARGEEVHAVVDIYSRTSAIAGWSIVALLRNLVSPIAF